MRQQDAAMPAAQHIAGYASQDPCLAPPMSISTGDHQISLELVGDHVQLSGIALRRCLDPHLSGDAMLLEPADDFCDLGARVEYLFLCCNLDDGDAVRLGEKRQGVGCG